MVSLGKTRVIVVVGPTASGKTRLGVELARRFRGEIISADSRQVYRGLDIGTGKDLAEYGTGADRVRLHLVDVVDPQTDDYHVHRFVTDAATALAAIEARAALPVIVGGTALYLNALLDGYELRGGGRDAGLRERLAGQSVDALRALVEARDPGLAARVDWSQRARALRAAEIALAPPAAVGECGPPALEPLLLGPFHPRATMHRRIEARLDTRLAGGLVDEVRQLHARGLGWERLAWFGLEYRHVAAHLQGLVDAERMRAGLLAGIRRLCRAQDVWFRKMEREGKRIHWIPNGDPAAAAALVQSFLAGAQLPEPQIKLSELHYGPRSN